MGSDAYAQEPAEHIMKLAKDAGIEVMTRIGRTLFDPHELVRNMTHIQKAGDKINHGNPEKRLDSSEYQIHGMHRE
jgi:cryptochrome